MKKTSIDCYHEIRDNGTITRKQREVLTALEKDFSNHATARMLSARCPGAWKRLSELVALGMVVECAPVRCGHSNKMVTTYRSTGQQLVVIPRLISKKPTRRQLEARIEQLEAHCEEQTKKLGALYDAAYKAGVLAERAGCAQRIGCDLEVTE